MPDDFDLNPVPVAATDPPAADPVADPNAPNPNALPAELQGKSPEESAGLVREANERATNAEQATKQANELSQRLAMNAFGNPPAAAADPATPPVEVDPDDPNAVALQQIRQDLDAFKTQGQQQLAQTQSMAAQSEIARQRDHMRMNPDLYPGYVDMEADVDKVLAQYQPDQQASVNARHAAYTFVLGQKTIERQREESKNAQAALGAGGRQTAAAEPTPGGAPTNTKLTPDQQSYAAREQMPAAMFAAMAGPGIMSIDEFDSIKAKHIKKGA